jgi:hypothetical protein
MFDILRMFEICDHNMLRPANTFKDLVHYMDGGKTYRQKIATTKHDGLSIKKFYCRGKSKALTSLKKTESKC